MDARATISEYFNLISFDRNSRNRLRGFQDLSLVLRGEVQGTWRGDFCSQIFVVRLFTDRCHKCLREKRMHVGTAFYKKKKNVVRGGRFTGHKICRSNSYYGYIHVSPC